MTLEKEKELKNLLKEFSTCYDITLCRTDSIISAYFGVNRYSFDEMHSFLLFWSDNNLKRKDWAEIKLLWKFYND